MDSKSTFTSLTILGIILAALGHAGFFSWAATKFGTPIPTDYNDTAQLLIGLIGDGMAVYGRMRASQPLHFFGFTFAKDAQGGFARVELLLVMALAVLISACAMVKPASPEQAVYEAQGNFIAALDVANAYKALPACGSPGATAVCSSPATVARVAGAANCAASVLAVAQNKVRGLANTVQVKCADPGMVMTTQAVNSLDITGIAALVKQVVGTFGSMAAGLRTK